MGTFKVNVKEPPSDADDETPTKKSARMIMRADGVLRVMLNSPIFKAMPVGEVSGEEPKGKQLNLASVEDGKTVPLLLRVSFTSSLSCRLWYCQSLTFIVIGRQRRFCKGIIPRDKRSSGRIINE